MIDWENDVRADIMESGKAGSGKAAGRLRGKLRRKLRAEIWKQSSKNQGRE